MKGNLKGNDPTAGANQQARSLGDQLPQSPFSSIDSKHATKRQLAIAALIQHIWDRVSTTLAQQQNGIVHQNAGVSQSSLPPADRWANIFSAIFLDQWIDKATSLSHGFSTLRPGSQGEHRAARVLFMLWSIARYGGSGEPTRARRRPADLEDIPGSDLTEIRRWWELSLRPSTDGEIDRRFEETFQPTFSQRLLDRCIVRAAIACRHLQDADLDKMAAEKDLDDWANALAQLRETCEILRRQSESKSSPTILITGPTTTGKSAIAWQLSNRLRGLAISADPFQICARPPIALGVGLPSPQPPQGVRSCLYRSRVPGQHRPSPDTITQWVGQTVGDPRYAGMPKIIEGGSVSSATALWQAGIPDFVIVLDAAPSLSTQRVKERMLQGAFDSTNLLTEARAVRASGLEPTWVVQESLIYPNVFRCLDARISPNEMLRSIQRDWTQLVADQQVWFAELRSKADVVSLPPSKHCVESILRLVDASHKTR